MSFTKPNKNKAIQCIYIETKRKRVLIIIRVVFASNLD